MPPTSRLSSRTTSLLLVIFLALCWFEFTEGSERVLSVSQGNNFEELMKGQLTFEKKWKMISVIWQNSKANFAMSVKESLKNGNLTNSLYAIQAQTNNLFEAAVDAKKIEILDDLTKLYLATHSYLEQRDKYIFHYLPNEKGRSTQLPLPVPARMWLDKSGEEVPLCSAQFLYLVSRAIHSFVALNENDRTENMNELIAKFAPVVVNDHYDRWLFGDPGVFQVKGWGCNPGVFNHLDFLTKKKSYAFGTAKGVSYCNAVTDTDMWILAGVAEILGANRKNAQLVPIPDGIKGKMTAYVSEGTGLLKSRLRTTNLKNFIGAQVAGMNFDPGAWDDHRKNAYSGYTGKEFPTQKDKRAVRSIGWDISHARRFVHVFDTLYRSRESLGQAFPEETVLKCLANQFTYKVFNRDFSKPLFSNYMDGSNGWYRVGFAGRKGFGYAPYDLSIAAITGGYGFWCKHNSDMQRIMNALWKMIGSKDPAIVSHRERHYERSHYRNFIRKTNEDLDSPSSLALMNFLCAYSTP